MRGPGDAAPAPPKPFALNAWRDPVAPARRLRWDIGMSHAPSHIVPPEPMVAPSDVNTEALASQWLAEFIRWTIVEEPFTLPRLLSDAGSELFRRHAATLPRPTDEVAIRRHIANLWRGEVGWAARWIAARLLASPPGADPVRVVDASCGVGTNAMLFGRLGAAVTAMDIRPDHLNVARWRSAHLTWLRHDHGPVTFRRPGLSHGFPDTCDLVWLESGMSRIDPAGFFLDLVRRQLRPGGVLMIGESQPSAAAAAGPPELSPLHETFTASDGRRYGQAFRAPLRAGDLDRLLERHGFRILHHDAMAGRTVAGAGLLRRCPPAVARLLRLDAAGARRSWVIATPE